MASAHSSAPANTPRASRHPVAGALGIAFAALFTLAGYEYVRSVSTSLYIEAYTADRVPLVMALGTVSVFAFLYGYARVLSRVGPQYALVLTTLASGAAILACYLCISSGSRLATGALYIIREAYVVILIEQYWSFINSILTKPQASKLNGPICGIASLGSIAGAKLVSLTAVSMSSETLLLFAAASVIPAAALSWLAYRLGGEPAPTPAEKAASHGSLALGLFRTHRILVYIALLILLTQITASVLELRFNGLLETAKPIKDLRTEYLGEFWFYINLVAAALQFIVAPLLLHTISTIRLHAAIPLIHLAACTVLLVHPTLTTGAVAFLLFKALDYSLFRAAKELLYLPLSFDARYRAKELIDAFGYRASKGGTAGVLAVVGQLIGGIPGPAYAVIALGSAAAWLGVVSRLPKDQPPLPSSHGT